MADALRFPDGELPIVGYFIGARLGCIPAEKWGRICGFALTSERLSTLQGSVEVFHNILVFSDCILVQVATTLLWQS